MRIIESTQCGLRNRWYRMPNIIITLHKHFFSTQYHRSFHTFSQIDYSLNNYLLVKEGWKDKNELRSFLKHCIIQCINTMYKYIKLYIRCVYHSITLFQVFNSFWLSVYCEYLVRSSLFGWETRPSLIGPWIRNCS